MNLKEYKNIYMIGIGGISMSGLAEILKSWGYNVAGSDQKESDVTMSLKQNGIPVFIPQNKENINSTYDLVVYTAAIKQDNPEIVQSKELMIPIIERGAFLGELTKLFENTIGIAGTHGKTTTTSMVSSIFINAKLDPTIQVGAYLDLIHGNYRVGHSPYFIIEACEYSDSYQSFKQKSAIVLNIDNDHLDYFKNIDNIEASFQKYVSHLPEDGVLVINNDDIRCAKLKNYTKAKVITVGKCNALYTYQNVSYDNQGFPSYDLYYEGKLLTKIELKVFGMHNVLNSMCAIALARFYQIDMDNIKAGLLNFHGASRRLEFKGMFNEAKVYDDYGHHPSEIKATLEGIGQMKFHESWVVFEPHTYSRLKSHLEEFAKVLGLFNHIIITDIYAAREINTFNISEQDLILEIKKQHKDAIHISDYEEIKKYLKDHVQKEDIIITLGAGNVTKLSDMLGGKK